MKHVKLFFALFAMLALGVTNAWADVITLTTNSTTVGKGTPVEEQRFRMKQLFIINIYVV